VGGGVYSIPELSESGAKPTEIKEFTGPTDHNPLIGNSSPEPWGKEREEKGNGWVRRHSGVKVAICA
jgi:hypothetical protein